MLQGKLLRSEELVEHRGLVKVILKYTYDQEGLLGWRRGLLWGALPR